VEIIGIPTRPVSPDQHRRAARMFASGVTVAAARHRGRVHAITATAFASLSLEPPLVLLAISNQGRLLKIIRDAGHFAVSVLGSGQRQVCDWAATTGRDDITNATAGLHAARSGAPLIPGAIAWFECHLESISRHGDHTLLVGLVVDAWADADGDPLVYFRSGYHQLGERIADSAGLPEAEGRPSYRVEAGGLGR
jgi:flavin reductase (NADH)